MTDDELNRIDKQFDSLEETFRCGFARMHSRINLMLLNQLSQRMDSMERKADERHAAILAAIRDIKP